MSMKLITRQSFRFYMAALGVLGVWSLLGSTGVLSMDPILLGYSWVGLAAAGTVLAIGLYRTRKKTFAGSKKERKRFERHSLSSTPLLLYGLAIAGMSVVFGAWYAGVLEVGPTVLAYGWFAVTAYGAVLLVGLVTKHSSAVVDTVVPTSGEKKEV